MKNYFIGIDVSKLTLDVALHSSEGYVKSNHVVIENESIGFKKMLSWFKEKEIDSKKVFICMEHTGIYTDKIVKFLEKKQISYTLQSPFHVKRSLGLARGKDDKVDSFRLAQFCYEKRESLKETVQPSKNLIVLKQLLTERKRFVFSKSQYKQIRSEVAVHQDKSSQKRKDKMIKFLEKTLLEIENKMLAIINSEIELKKNYSLLCSIIGIGFVNAMCTIVYTNNFKSFSDARSYACYVGVAPFEHRSGTSIHKKTSVSKMGRHLLKAELTQAAKSAILNDPQIKSYFKRKFNNIKGNESNYGSVLNAIKFKLICRMFAVIKRQTPYTVLNF